MTKGAPGWWELPGEGRSAERPELRSGGSLPTAVGKRGAGLDLSTPYECADSGRAGGPGTATPPVGDHDPGHIVALPVPGVSSSPSIPRSVGHLDPPRSRLAAARHRRFRRPGPRRAAPLQVQGPCPDARGEGKTGDIPCARTDGRVSTLGDSRPKRQDRPGIDHSRGRESVCIRHGFGRRGDRPAIPFHDRIGTSIPDRVSS